MHFRRKISSRATPKDVVTSGASVAFSQLWLVPRLLRFHALHPGAAFA